MKKIKMDDCEHLFTFDKPKKIAYLIILNVLYIVLPHIYIMIKNIILNLYVTLKNVFITLVLLNPLYFYQKFQSYLILLI